jgi:hypothetical protein
MTFVYILLEQNRLSNFTYKEDKPFLYTLFQYIDNQIFVARMN